MAPDQSIFYLELCAESWCAGRRKDSEEALRLASERKIETPKLLVFEYDLAFLTDDHDGMQKAVKAAQGNPDAVDSMADAQAFSFAHAGRLKEARIRRTKPRNWRSSKAIANGPLSSRSSLLSGKPSSEMRGKRNRQWPVPWRSQTIANSNTAPPSPPGSRVIPSRPRPWPTIWKPNIPRTDPCPVQLPAGRPFDRSAQPQRSRPSHRCTGASDP